MDNVLRGGHYHGLNPDSDGSPPPAEGLSPKSYPILGCYHSLAWDKIYVKYRAV